MRAVAAVVWIGERPDACLPSIASLRAAHPDLPIHAGGPARGIEDQLDGWGVTVVPGPLWETVEAVAAERQAHVLVVAAPTAFPPRFLDRAVAIVDEDIRMATVSFFSNAAAFASFPYRNVPVSYQVDDLDEVVITRRLRTPPDLLAAPIPFAAGPAVLVSSYALSAVQPLPSLAGVPPELVLTEFSVRARRKGFYDVLDPSTYCTRLFDVGVPFVDVPAALDAPGRHGEEAGVLAEARDLLADAHSSTSPIATVHAAARTKVMGLRVLLDGFCLATKETGTQVQAVALIAALARRPEIAKLVVAVGGDLPPYARAVLAEPKVEVRVAPRGELAGFEPVDVGHQPFQPDGPLTVEALARVASRTVVTMLDLIAYRARSYSGSAGPWLAYRRRVQGAVARADAIVVPAADVRRQLDLERLAIERDRLFVVELGTDHLKGDQPEAVPAELLARGPVGDRFVLVLGASYGHKNRDIAIGVIHELRERGLGVELVLAGPMFTGSSRVLETLASARAPGGGVVTIPGVTSAERNWLLRHASLVLYPTSAEGFGLVPFEAAWFGTPTVLTPVGPLQTIAADLPVVAADWSVKAMADAAQALLADPVTAEAQVAAALAVGARMSWDACAEKLVDVYRSIVARPPNGAAVWAEAYSSDR